MAPGLVVVGHDPRARPDARRAHHARDLLRRPARDGGPAGRPRPPPGRGEVGVHVEEHGAGDVPGRVGVAAAARGVEVPAHVHDPQVGRRRGGRPASPW